MEKARTCEKVSKVRMIMRPRDKREHEKHLEEPVYAPLTSPVKYGSYGLAYCEL